LGIRYIRNKIELIYKEVFNRFIKTET